MNSFRDEGHRGYAVVSKDGVPHHIVVQGVAFDRFGLLSAAVRAGRKNSKAAWEIMHVASCLFHPQNDPVFNNLYAAAALHITWTGNVTEASLYPKFNEAIVALSEGKAVPIKVAMDQGHRPDSWVRMHGENIPVEIKLGSFDHKACRQLRRYMAFYGSSKGIAVGAQLTTCLPDSITFISIDEMEKALLEMDGGADRD